MSFATKRVQTRRRIGRVLVGVFILLIILVASVGSPLLVDWLWFSAVGYESVFLTILSTRVVLFAGSALFFFALFALNVGLTRRFVRRREDLWNFIASLEARRSDQLFYTICLAIGGLLAVLLGGVVAEHWDDVLRWRATQSFGQSDPLFGQDVGFYVFTLPIWGLAQSWLLAAGILLLISVLAIYVYKLILPQLPSTPVRGDAGMPEIRLNLNLDRAIKVHLAALVAVVLLLLAVGFWLDIYGLVYSQRGAAFGASYADVVVYQNVLKILVGLSIVGAVAVLVTAFLRGVQLAAVAVGLLLATWLIGGQIVPALVQRFDVQPNELVKERPYIENNIRMTRQAYALDRITEETYPIREAVTARDIAENPATIKNIRLWDPEPLLDTYNQIQSIRQYYDFLDTDVDRYTVDGEYRQVMLAARELSPERLQETAQTWVNRRLQYTHGYGAVVSPVNEVTPEGLPILFVRDVPPQGVIPIERPEIYYGEKTDTYVIVNTREAEFDYPQGDENVFTRYQGGGGVPLSTPLHRLLFAWRYADVNILLSNALTPDSQILFYRNIRTRVQQVAPFLLFDRDPYIVIHDGRLVWIHDAYTYTADYPYSQPAAQGYNYLRNSVKVVTDAYSGQMTFYLADIEGDPIIDAYAQIFPGMFKDLSEMPAGLRSHLRYPEDLFTAQADIYRTYHMQDPRVFYNKEDLWSIPREIYLDQQKSMLPYYVIMKLPNETREEFVLIRPYTPTNKDNMITWLAARSDGDNYGRLIAYKYPKDSLVYGPMQIESRINQDPQISRELSLWNQQGSRVLRGNLLVIPIGFSNLYVEPLYLQSEQSKLPELKRVILSTGVSTGGILVMEPTVGQAIEALFRGQPAPATAAAAPATEAQPATGPPGGLAAEETRRLAQTIRSRANDLRRELDVLERDLDQLLNSIGAPAEGAIAEPDTSETTTPAPATPVPEAPVPAGR